MWAVQEGTSWSPSFPPGPRDQDLGQSTEPWAGCRRPRVSPRPATVLLRDHGQVRLLPGPPPDRETRMLQGVLPGCKPLSASFLETSLLPSQLMFPRMLQVGEELLALLPTSILPGPVGLRASVSFGRPGPAHLGPLITVFPSGNSSMDLDVRQSICPQGRILFVSGRGVSHQNGVRLGLCRLSPRSQSLPIPTRAERPLPCYPCRRASLTKPLRFRSTSL